MSLTTAQRIRPFLIALVIGLGAPAFAEDPASAEEEPAQQATDEATQAADKAQQQASQSEERRKRPEGKVKPQEAQKGQDSSLSHDTDEESLDQENSSAPMMQPDGYSGG